MSDDTLYNPYEPPATERSISPTAVERKNLWLTSLCSLQILVMAIGLGLEAYDHHTIVGSGPVFAVVGMVIAGISRRKDRHLEFFAGVSAPLLTAFIVFLININGWSPTTGDKPITVIVSLYSAVFVPILAAAIVRQMLHKSELMQPDGDNRNPHVRLRSHDN
jgi:hypothetical protein